MEDKFYKAINATTGEVIAARVKIAQDFRSRSIGLLNRSSLDEDEGLLIKPCNSIHTFFMKFPIDAIFLDRKGVIVSVATDLQPWRLAFSMLRGFMVLELPAGKIGKTALKLGNSIQII
jgi:uncharacterized membrane protein (UPF0127 family)